MTSKLSRTRVTNGKALFLDGVDGRTLAARRYRDLFHSFVSDLGGMDITSEAQRQLARRCATMSCQAEVMEAEFVAGDDTDWDQYLHLVGTLSRALSHLGIERKALDVTGPTLEEYINGEYRGE